MAWLFWLIMVISFKTWLPYLYPIPLSKCFLRSECSETENLYSNFLSCWISFSVALICLCPWRRTYRNHKRVLRQFVCVDHLVVRSVNPIYLRRLWNKLKDIFIRCRRCVVYKTWGLWSGSSSLFQSTPSTPPPIGVCSVSQI